MWRLVNVQHVRCSDWDGQEYFLAPPDWTEDEIESKVDKIVNQMIDDAKAVQASPENPGYGPRFGDFPDLTVKEIKKDFAERQEAYKRWKEDNDRLERSFAARMEDAGFCPLWKAEEVEGTESIGVSASWGHSHSLSLNYKHAGSLY